MNTKFVTKESVAAAAQALTDAGQRPTVRGVILHLGGGSPNAVLPLLNAWKKENEPQLDAIGALDPLISALISNQISSAGSSLIRRLEDMKADAEVAAAAARQTEAQLVEANDQLLRAKIKLEAVSKLEAEVKELTEQLIESRQAEAVAESNLSLLQNQLILLQDELKVTQERERALLSKVRQQDTPY
jgi:chromosome segregation ATPase